jgi:thiamine-phosphate pyrophosphorylase
VIPSPRVILITDPSVALERIEQVIGEAGAVLGDDFLVQLRDPAASAVALRPTAERLLVRTRQVGSRFVLNARTAAVVDLAHAIGSDGVHVPCDAHALAQARARLGRDAWISCPAHRDDEVPLAATGGANAVLVSPIGETPDKGPPRGLAALERARFRAGPGLAVYALGGIGEELAPACAVAAADGVAVIRALLLAPDPARVARALAAPFSDRARV